MARALVHPGDTVLMAEPGFPGALSAFQVYGAQVVGLESDAEGIRVDALERALARAPAKLLYVVPSFHNPTGVSMSEPRRLAVLELAGRHGLPILEDDSGGDLRFEGESIASLHSLDRHALTTYVSSFSKKLLPGLRVGWATGPPAVRQRLMALKQLTDCSTSLLLQAALDEFCRQGLLERHLTDVRKQYRQRRDVMIQAMRRCFPEGVHWTEPEGGLVLWVTLPQGMDARELLVEARAQGVTFNAGELFYAGSPRRNQMRLTFGATPPQQIRRGIKILGEILSRCAQRGTGQRTAVPLV
jgi:DNA-binding transcriptional MocR family regulator